MYMYICYHPKVYIAYNNIMTVSFHLGFDLQPKTTPLYDSSCESTKMLFGRTNPPKLWNDDDGPTD